VRAYSKPSKKGVKLSVGGGKGPPPDLSVSLSFKRTINLR